MQTRVNVKAPYTCIYIRLHACICAENNGVHHATCIYSIHVHVFPNLWYRKLQENRQYLKKMQCFTRQLYNLHVRMYGGAVVGHVSSQVKSSILRSRIMENK